MTPQKGGSRHDRDYDQRKKHKIREKESSRLKCSQKEMAFTYRPYAIIPSSGTRMLPVCLAEVVENKKKQDRGILRLPCGAASPSEVYTTAPAGRLGRCPDASGSKSPGKLMEIKSPSKQYGAMDGKSRFAPIEGA